jgi:hypothetical protein
MKSESKVIARDVPAFCKRRNDIKMIIGLDKRIINLMHRPNNRLVLCKGRVKSSDTGLLIVVKNIFRFFMMVAGYK